MTPLNPVELVMKVDPHRKAAGGGKGVLGLGLKVEVASQASL